MRIWSPHPLPEGPSNSSLLAEPHHSKHLAGLFHSFSFNLKKDDLPSEELLGDHSQSTRWFLCDTQGFP